jgi:hypothetical protein
MQTSRWTPCYAVVEWTPAETLKYLRCEAGRTEQLYELNSDPMERTDLLPKANPAVLARLRGQLQHYLADTSVP